MKTIDLGITIDTEEEGQAIQSIVENAMMGVESFYSSTGRKKTVAAIKVLNLLEFLRDEAEDIDSEQ